jgi:hypothetical protein
MRSIIGKKNKSVNFPYNLRSDEATKHFLK